MASSRTKYKEELLDDSHSIVVALVDLTVRMSNDWPVDRWSVTPNF